MYRREREKDGKRLREKEGDRDREGDKERETGRARERIPTLRSTFHQKM